MLLRWRGDRAFLRRWGDRRRCVGRLRQHVLDTDGATPGGTETRSATAATPEHPLPPELQGSWLLESGPTTDLVRLYLRQTTYTASRGGGSHAGQVAVNGSVMEFTSLCGASSVEGVGRYHWTLAGDNLHLDLIGKDECTGRSAILEDATYKRHG